MVTELNAADVLIQTLIEHRVQTVFGLPGEEILTVLESIRTSALDFVVTRHEQHAAFMAATMGRLTGIPGLCLATLGPGATNLFTGLAHAYLGGFPMIALTGQKPSLDNPEGSFQVLDIVGSAGPLVKHAVTINDPMTISAVMADAFRIATTGRPGPVLVELPEDVAAAVVESTPPATATPAIPYPNPAAVEAAVDMIASAKRPLFLVSEHGNRSARGAALTLCAEATGIGVVTTQLGKGSIDESHPLAIAALGIHRPDYSHHPVFDADLIIAVGYDPVEHPPLSWNPQDDKAVVHIAPWPASVERGYRPRLDVIGDIAATLDDLARRVQPRPSELAQQKAKTVRALLNDEPTSAPDAVPSPLDVVRAVRATLDPSDVVALDNGAYKVWFARHYETANPQTLLLDNALATMGAGLATGMTAALVHPDSRVISVCGDGGFMMNLQDVETAVRLGLDLTVLVVRDDTYGFIEWHQDEDDLPNFGVHVTNPDIGELAAAFGATPHRAATVSELSSALSDAAAMRGLNIIDCLIDYTINEMLDDDLFERSRSQFVS